MTKRFLYTAVCVLMTSLGGCRSVGSQPDGEQAEWIQNVKALGGTGATTGVSREAREIEKSLSAR